MRTVFATCLLLCALPVWAAELRWSVPAEEWARPHDSEDVLSIAPIRQSVQQWMQSPGQVLVIQYPGGEEGVMWGNGLRDWLVALGVPSSHVEAIPGHSRNDEMIIFLRRQGDY